MSTPLDTDFVLVNRGATSYKVTVGEMYNKIQASDTVLAQAGTQSYALSGEKFLGKDFDGLNTYFLINRGSLSYKILGDDLVDDPDPRQDIVGAIAYWPGSTANVPEDWFVCNGQQISATDYPELAALLPGGGGLINLPNYATSTYLNHTDNDSQVSLTRAAQVNVFAFQAALDSSTNTIQQETATWSGSGITSQYSHSHNPNGRQDFNSSPGSYDTAIPHENSNPTNQHRGTDSSWNYMTFGSVIRWGHNHAQSSLTFPNAGSHSHVWSGSVNAPHNHGSGSVQASTPLDGSTTVELNSYSLIPIIYAGVKGLT